MDERSGVSFEGTRREAIWRLAYRGFCKGGRERRHKSPRKPQDIQLGEKIYSHEKMTKTEKRQKNAKELKYLSRDEGIKFDMKV